VNSEASLVVWQRIEALLTLLAMLALYFWTGAPWWLFFLLFLVPDLTMLGYLAGPRTGAVVYNLGHVYAGPALLTALAVLATRLDLAPEAFRDITPLAIIWASHIAFDRVLGYGLKSPSGFKMTHLGRIGRQETDQ